MIVDVTAVILAGGNSTRFGSNKAFALWDNCTLVQHLVNFYRGIFSQVTLVVKEREPFAFLSDLCPVRIYEDLEPGFHAAGGIYAALCSMGTSYAFISSCDSPFPSDKLIQALCRERNGYDAVVPVWDGIPQPLFTLYSRSCLDRLKLGILSGDFKLQRLLYRIRTKFFEEPDVRQFDPEGASFIDIDTPHDYEKAKIFAASHAG